jgi:hypothetical protein
LAGRYIHKSKIYPERHDQSLSITVIATVDAVGGQIDSEVQICITENDIG